MHTARAVLAGALLLATLSCATAKSGPFIETTVKLDGETCEAFQGELWVINWIPSHVLKPKTEEVVRRYSDVHVLISESGQAVRLADELGRIASKPCGENGACEGMDLRFVANFSGAKGCERRFVADSWQVVDLSRRRKGNLGAAFWEMFSFKIGQNCRVKDAWGPLLSATWNRGAATLADFTEEVAVGPVTWSEFQENKPSLAGNLDEVPSLVGERRFYYIRLRWSPTKYSKNDGDSGTVEGIVTEDDCEAVKVRFGNSEP